jgi:hypothetical protein
MYHQLARCCSNYIYANASHLARCVLLCGLSLSEKCLACVNSALREEKRVHDVCCKPPNNLHGSLTVWLRTPYATICEPYARPLQRVLTRLLLAPAVGSRRRCFASPHPHPHPILRGMEGLGPISPITSPCPRWRLGSGFVSLPLRFASKPQKLHCQLLLRNERYVDMPGLWIRRTSCEETNKQ